MDEESKKSDIKTKIDILRREGEERAAEQLAKKLGYPYADTGKIPMSLDAVKVIPENEARDARVAGIEIKGKQLALIAVNPNLPATKKIITDLKNKKYEVKVFVVSQSGLASAWRFYKFVKPATENITGKVSITKARLSDLIARFISIDAVNRELANIDFLKTSVVTIIEIILAGSLSLRASDIHMEAQEKGAKLRFRIDGLLHDIFSGFPQSSYGNLISHIKLLSGMKLNVHDEAQDGRFAIRLAEKEVEMRVSILPAEFGETIVMRILDPAATMIGLPQLGLREDNLKLVKKQLNKPNGLILNTGPTGSGKTTTLYAFLRSINSPEEKIITLEDPIEYQIEGIEQTQVDEEAGYTFANGLRAIVRQDPDIILVGEIRDLETADIALQASLTGHLVLSTLHTNDAVGAVPRLINLGIKSVSIGPALTLVIAQRLVRVLCLQCKKQTSIDTATAEKIKKFLDRMPAKIDKQKYANPVIYEPVGCDKCNKMGYMGRVGIFEFLEGGPDIESTILKEASEIALREVAKRQEMVTMQEDGILKVISGDTTFDEVVGATGEIEW